MSGDWKQQPWWIKALRWLRYKPAAAIVAAWASFIWIAKGCPRHFAPRWSTFETIWFTHVKSMAEFRMGNHRSTQEFLDDLRLRGRITVTPTCHTLTDTILVAFAETPTVLYEEPHNFDRWLHGMVEHGSFDLTIDQAEWVAKQLLKAVKQSRKWEKECQKA